MVEGAAAAARAKSGRGPRSAPSSRMAKDRRRRGRDVVRPPRADCQTGSGCAAMSRGGDRRDRTGGGRLRGSWSPIISPSDPAGHHPSSSRQSRHSGLARSGRAAPDCETRAGRQGFPVEQLRNPGPQALASATPCPHQPTACTIRGRSGRTTDGGQCIQHVADGAAPAAFGTTPSAGETRPLLDGRPSARSSGAEPPSLPPQP